MSLSSSKVLDNIRYVLKNTSERRNPLVNININTQEISKEATISNTLLLLETLEHVYSDEDKASYLPMHVDSVLNGYLNTMRQSLDQLSSNHHPSYATNFFNAADQLYAACLQYGLITFGFQQKELVEIITDLRAKRKMAQRIADKIQSECDSIVEGAKNSAAISKQEFADRTTQLQQDLEQANKGCQAASENLKSELAIAQKIQADCQKLQEGLLERSEAIVEKETEVNSLAKEVSENAREAKAETSIIKETRANAKTEMEEILAFYEQIDAHQKAMREIHKDADSKYNSIQSEYTKLQELLKKQTGSIIEENKNLQNEIKEHLRKAVGASLFSAFDTRRQGISAGKQKWALALFSFVGAGVGVSWWLATSLGASGIESAFFVKLSAVIPITFAIVFAARQYANERRAEEEYAFKSAISLSLEPYKDLLQRMKKDGYENEAQFVEHLLKEIFDNPVKHIYSAVTTVEAEPSVLEIAAKDLKAIKPLLRISKDIDIDHLKQILDFIAERKDPSKAQD